MEKWKKINREIAYQSKVIDVYKENIIKSNGEEVVYDLVHCKSGACVLPVTKEKEIILIKQYRNSLDDVTYEIPGGCYDHIGEDPKICAARELEEEIGIKAKNLIFFQNIITAIGMADERCAIFFGEDLVEGQRKLDQDEEISVEKIPIEKAYEMVLHGEIVDAKTVVAILGYQLLRA